MPLPSRYVDPSALSSRYPTSAKPSLPSSFVAPLLTREENLNTAGAGLLFALGGVGLAVWLLSKGGTSKARGDLQGSPQDHERRHDDFVWGASRSLFEAKNGKKEARCDEALTALERYAAAETEADWAGISTTEAIKGAMKAREAVREHCAKKGWWR